MSVLASTPEAAASPITDACPPIKRALQPITHAFQPIVDVATRSVFAFEALLRSTDNTPARTLLNDLDGQSLQALDRRSRIAAMALASRLGMSARISLNALPHSLGDENDSPTALVDEAARAGFAVERIIIEVTEDELIADVDRFHTIANKYRTLGFLLAIDDFGAGHSGLNLLADFQPDIIKLDMNLVRNIAARGPRQSIARAIIQVCEDLGIDVIAEGVETVDEYEWFAGNGITLFQGFLFGRPSFQSLGVPEFPNAR
jgi:EAL domain-containing protein (putative c-di-GMP-specific phosphodiesterase class I)